MKSKFLYIFIFLSITLLNSCTSKKKDTTEIFQKSRNNIINYSDSIKDINGKILTNEVVLLDIIDSFLILNDINTSNDKFIQIYNKNTFKHIINTAKVGRGPGEVTRIGEIGLDYKNHIMWVQDLGKMALWKFPIDSVINDSNFLPKMKVNLNHKMFVNRFDFLDKNTILGKAVYLSPNHSVLMTMARQNLQTDKIERFGYEHPDAIGKKSKSYFRLSIKNNMYINCYSYCDLITICNLDGTLKFNIYGPYWKKKNDKYAFYEGVRILNNCIITSYIGELFVTIDEHKRPKAKFPNKLMIFDINGNYLKTINIGYQFTSFCVDNENNRVFFYFINRDHPVGYINLKLN